MKKLIAPILAVVAAVVYFASLAHCAYPGESAHLISVWSGYDIAAGNPYPLMECFARLFGGGNLIAPVFGVIAVVLVFLLTRFFTSLKTAGVEGSSALPDIAGSVAAVVFMFTPAVYSSATHLEPRLFDFAWILVSLALVIPFGRLGRVGSLVFPLLAGVMAGLGYTDSPLVIAMAPFYLVAIVWISFEAERKPYLPITIFAVSFLLAFVIGAKVFGADSVELLKTMSKVFRSYYSIENWLFVAAFSTLPLVAVAFSSSRAYSERPTFVVWVYHTAMTVASILAIATPLSPSSRMEPFGIMPVATSAFAAFVAGHLISFWWRNRRLVVSMVVGGVFTIVLLITVCWNFFTFDGAKGDFADRIAEKIITALGDRKWFVTDGSLDDHLRIAAAKSGREVNLISLNRDLDTEYLDQLGKLVREKGVGGSKNDELSLALSLGVLPFVQDWFVSDPSVKKDVAIYGAPDLWYVAGYKPVPEVMFFGADESVKPDWSIEKELCEILSVPKHWGSYRSRNTDDPVTRLRYSVRRHLGFVANNYGTWLQDEKRDDEAFGVYEQVLNEIDPDNICALFNEMEMVSAKHPKALAKQHEIEGQLKKVVDDKERRYYIWRLGSYYGYIRNPDVFIRLGYTWARSGRPGDALSQIRRAIDFVPTEKKTALLNMMASLYATEDDRAKSRQLYEQILAKNEHDHDALIGMMRLELLEGNSDKAIMYLQKAAEQSGESRAAKIELAMVSLIKNEFDAAKSLLKQAVDMQPNDLQGWSLLAAVEIQRFDASKDEKEKAKILKELQSNLLPEMEKHAADKFDYFVQTTKAFILMRQGGDKRREARDALALASKSRPSATMTQNMMLGLDISLDDPETARTHAMEMLRNNRDEPLANYVMGSLALKAEDYVKAEAFLRKAADAKKPVLYALNDMAEALRRLKRFDEAERYARRATQTQPKFYVAWDTLGSILLDAGRKPEEAEECAKKAIELGKDEKGNDADVRVYVTLARAQLATGKKSAAQASLKKVQAQLKTLTPFERKEFEDLRKRAR